MIGETLKHYQIESLLGAGGMGEVYRAKDTRLGRSVAVKVLPEAFAHDADRLSRFDREAKLLASLNHPNIAALYGMEEADGKHFLVMELVEGETLAERLRRGSIPALDALKIAHQMAEALEAAHEGGVIHHSIPTDGPGGPAVHDHRPPRAGDFPRWLAPRIRRQPTTLLAFNG